MTTSGYLGLVDNTVGLYYFTGIGTGDYHSLKSDFDGVVTAKAQRTNVTVSTASSHGLFVNDQVIFKLAPALRKSWLGLHQTEPQNSIMMVRNVSRQQRMACCVSGMRLILIIT